MTVSFGRVGVPTASGGDGVTMLDPFEVVLSGREMSIIGYYRGADAATTIWMRDQILGLSPDVNTDELVMPFVFSDTNSNGYYRVTSVSAGVPRGSLGSGGLFHFDWQITATRAVEFRRTRIDMPTVYGLLVNGMGVTTGDIVHGLPTGASVYRVFFAATYSGSRTSETGAVLLASYDDTATASSGTASYSIAPASFYVGSCRVEYNVSGTYYSVVGRRDLDLSTSARITNGLIRVTPASSTTFTVEWYVSGSWTSASTYSISDGGGAGTFTISDLTVLRNSAEECVLRLWGNLSTPGNGATVDISIRRGDRLARLYCSAVWGPQWRLAHTTVVAHTAAALYGIRRTASINSNYTVMMSDYATTQDLVNGRLTSASRSKVLFGIGCSVGTVVTDVPDGAQSVGQQFYQIVSDSQRLVVG